MDLLIRDGVIVTPAGESRADIAVLAGRVQMVGLQIPHPDGTPTLDAAGLKILPGLVDMALHAGDGPDAEAVAAATQQAVLGGVTTATLAVTAREGENLRARLDAARATLGANSAADWGLTLRLTAKPDVSLVRSAIRAANVTTVAFALGAKKSGDALDDGEALAVLRAIAGHALAAVVPANGGVTNALLDDLRGTGARGGRAHATAWPAWAEAEAVHRAWRLAQAAGCQVAVDPVTCAAALEEVVRGKEAGAPLFASASLPHLALHDRLLEGDAGHLWACEPPLRPEGDARALTEAVQSGLVDAVASHHRAVPHADKRRGERDAASCEPGIAAVASLLPMLWTEGVERGRLSAEALVAALCETPAKMLGLYPRKGAIAVGADADFVLIDPNRARPVPESVEHPLAGQSLKGWPVATVLRGKLIARDGAVEGGTVTEMPERIHGLG